MRSAVRPLVLAIAALAVASASARAQTGLMADLTKDMHDVHKKLVDLAKAMPADKYSWRPGPGVRSVGEVFLHVASDNYLIPAMAGAGTMPAETGIDMKDMATLGKYEKQQMTPEATAAEMNKSFGFLAKAMGSVPDSRMDEKIKFFGQDMTMRQVWLLTVNHLHEHLGQAIAYARSNGVKPPWSQQ